MEKDFQHTLAKAASRLQRVVFKILSIVKGMVNIIIVEDNLIESKKTFYLLSVTLVISLVFLSPDKIPQIFTPSSQTNTEIFEKLQEVAKIIKKLVLNIG